MIVCNVFRFYREKIIEYANTLKTVDAQIIYLKCVRKEYRTNPPDLDPNYGKKPGLVKVLDEEIKYREELLGITKNSDEKESSKTKTRFRDEVSNEIIAEEVTKCWDDGLENLEKVYALLSDKSKNIFGIKLTKGQIKGRYQRYCTINKDSKREKYK